MLKNVRQSIIDQLWRIYHDTTPHIRLIEAALQDKNITHLPLDHLAIIDLPGPQSGIPVLRELFEIIGFTVRGKGYLPDKQNDFTWLAEEDSHENDAAYVLPQVVVADFRLDQMPEDIRSIILKYSKQTAIAPLADIRKLANEETLAAEEQLISLVVNYLTGRDWPAPTVAEFKRVQAFNELLAWVLMFGRRPNHFTISVHLLENFMDLPAFHEFIESDVKLSLNQEGGVIKGDKTSGISQGSTVGIAETIRLNDGLLDLPTGFVEFVWRYPRPDLTSNPVKWNDYFTGFVAHHANHVIESLC